MQTNRRSCVGLYESIKDYTLNTRPLSICSLFVFIIVLKLY